MSGLVHDWRFWAALAAVPVGIVCAVYIWPRVNGGEE